MTQKHSRYNRATPEEVVNVASGQDSAEARSCEGLLTGCMQTSTLSLVGC
jgi:hypothetical protein